MSAGRHCKTCKDEANCFKCWEDVVHSYLLVASIFDGVPVNVIGKLVQPKWPLLGAWITKLSGRHWAFLSDPAILRWNDGREGIGVLGIDGTSGIPKPFSKPIRRLSAMIVSVVAWPRRPDELLARRCGWDVPRSSDGHRRTGRRRRRRVAYQPKFPAVSDGGPA